MPEAGKTPDYEKLYHIMVNASERALELLEEAQRLLIEAEQAAESAYLDP